LLPLIVKEPRLDASSHNAGDREAGVHGGEAPSNICIRLIM
jgi:hypothetical protein